VVGNCSTFSASPRDLPIRTPHREKVLSSYGRSNGAVDRPVVATFVDLEGRIPTVWTGLSNSAVDVAPQFEERINNLRDPSDQHLAFVTKSNPNLVTLRGHGIGNHPGFINLKHADANQIQDHRTDSELSSHNAGYINDISKRLSASAIKLHSVALDKLRRNAQIDSQPQLFHPIPMTSRTSRVLCYTCSEAGTTVAQIGVEPIATRSQMLDEEIWKTWVLSSMDDLPSESENGRDDDVSISPGISNFGHRHVQKYSKQTMEEHARDIRSTPEVNSIDYTPDQETEQSRFESPMDIEDESNRMEVLLKVQESTHYEDVTPVREAVDYKTLFLQRPQKIPSPPKPKPVRVDNPDEAWMKFILSDNDDDIEEDILKPSGQRKPISPTVIQLPPASSVVVHLSTATSSSSQHEIATSSCLGAITTPGNTNMNIANFLIDDPRLSNHTTQGSNQSSSDELSDILSSVDQIRTRSSPFFLTPSRSFRKLTFTKPPRFPSPTRGSSPETTAATAGSPVHIGRGFLLATLRDRGADSGKGRREGPQGRDTYGLESEDDIESIEDD
jgi:hypothetical protein